MKPQGTFLYGHDNQDQLVKIAKHARVVGEWRLKVAAMEKDGYKEGLQQFQLLIGHVNPSRANDQGLIYDTQFKDYLPFLCGLNYTNRQVGNLVQRKVDCREVKRIAATQLNYPSFSITFREVSQTYTRLVTNVGEAKLSYSVEIASPPGVSVIVKPSTLKFSKLNHKLKYQVTFTKIDNF
ncbi:hypothetical protein H5410_051237 [Solanum commersonii]|uniref:Subtilisin-like protease fibronectin type-III domain-containing protein n=1 Tax=Solanum commersonii TaxID=4109 RepID=A0A9J5WXV5_SOLCO|nr:hypothetical protein H5410_051237 [Solanum commersonii]